MLHVLRQPYSESESECRTLSMQVTQAVSVEGDVCWSSEPLDVL
jgi:hypothetical protein